MYFISALYVVATIFAARCVGPMYSAHFCGKMSVCLSVYLSVTRRYCIETAKHVIKLFFTAWYPQHSSFFIPYYGNIPRGTLRRKRRMQMSRHINKSRDFRPMSRFMPEIISYKIWSYFCHRMWIGNRTQAFEWYCFEWPWTTPNLDVNSIIWNWIYQKRSEIETQL